MREHVVAAFSSTEVPAHHVNLVQPFTRTTTRAATAATVREAKRAVNQRWARAVAFETALRPLADRIRQTQYALQRGVPEDQRTVVLAQHRRRLEAYAPIRAQAEDNEEELKQLQLVQAECEAAYSQDELLSFLKRHKYTRTVLKRKRDDRRRADAMPRPNELGRRLTSQRG